MTAAIRALVVTLGLLAAASVRAEVDAQVAVEDGRYHLTVDARVDAAPEAVRALLLDYADFASLSSSVNESTVVRAGPPARVRLVNRVCVAFICRTLVSIQDIRETIDGTFVGRVIPDESDFAWGESRWRIDGENGGSRLTVESGLEPAFWVPPLVGPWLVRRALVAEVREVIANLERRAGEAAP